MTERKVMESIHKRISVRSYSDAPLPKAARDTIEQFCGSDHTGPFGNSVRIEVTSYRGSGERIGTYGFIRGARTFAAALARPGYRWNQDVGFCFEEFILEMTETGLGTCWLGGTFRRSDFDRLLERTADEKIPVVSPVGIPAEKPAAWQRLIRAAAGSRKRKPWTELFFTAGSGSGGLLPVSEDFLIPGIDEKWKGPLSCLRAAPSASNKQPWRMVLQNNQGTAGVSGCHLFIRRNGQPPADPDAVSLQDIDIGIGMCNFQKACEASGIQGNWSVVKEIALPEIPDDWEYTVTWEPVPGR